MSVLVTALIPADTEQFRSWITSDTETTDRLSERARAQGCAHHCFAVGDGQVLVVDEWESAEAFEKFFADPDVGAALQGAGAQGPPVVSFYEVIEADRF